MKLTLLQIVHGGHTPTSQHSGEDGELLQLRRGDPHLLLPLQILPRSLQDKLSVVSPITNFMRL